MSRKAKDDKPVNISISFNIANKDVVNSQKEKSSPAQCRGRKISNIETIKTHRDTPLQGLPVRPEDLTDRYTYSRDESRHDELSRKRKMKRQSMDGIFDSKKAADLMFMSCGNDKICEKPQIPKAKFTHLMSTKRKAHKPKPQKPYLQTKSQTRDSAKIETTVMKSVMNSHTKQKLSVSNLKNLISKLIASQLQKHQDSARTKVTNTARQPRNQSKLRTERKKTVEVSKRTEVRKRPTSKQSNSIQGIKLNSLQRISDSSLIKTQSQKQDPHAHTVPDIHLSSAMKTSSSNAHLREMVRMSYIEQEPHQYTSVEEFMATKIQRFWRQYKTKQLIKLYVQILRDNEEGHLYAMHGMEPQHQEEEFATQEQLQTEEEPQVTEIILQPEKRPIQEIPFIPEQYSGSKNIRQHNSDQLIKDQLLPQAAEFKKIQINKWDETLQFISKNINCSDMKSILLQVARQLEMNRNLLEKETPNKKNPNEVAQFTAPLNSKRDISEEDQQLEKQINELGQSYVSESSNEQLNSINFKSLHQALNKRKQALLIKQSKQLRALQEKLEVRKVTKDVYEQEVERLSKWIKHEQAEIRRAKQHLQTGLNKTKNIIDKNHGDEQFFHKLTEEGIKRCLSDSSFRQLKSRSRVKQHISSQSEDSQENHILKRTSQQLSAKRLKQKLKNLNSASQKSSPEKINDFTPQSKGKFHIQNLSESDEQDKIIRNELKLISQDDNGIFGDLDRSDKENIFQFVFLDLCVEFCEEVVESKRGSLIFQYYNKRKSVAYRRSKGIKTSITIVRQYLKKFVSFIGRVNRSLMERVTIPMGPSAQELLKYMHYSDGDDEDAEDTDLVDSLVLPSSAFQAFEKTLIDGIEFVPYYDDPKKQSNRAKFLKEIIHIHNKAIFDALNESLDLQRPFGIWGKPFPWKKVPQFTHILTDQQKELKFKQSCERVVEHCSYVCGIIIDKEDSLVAPGAKLSQDYIDQIKQDRLSRMLASDLVQNQVRWIFYDDEEAQVLVEIAYLSYELILKDAAQQILRIIKK